MAYVVFQNSSLLCLQFNLLRWFGSFTWAIQCTRWGRPWGQVPWPDLEIVCKTAKFRGTKIELISLSKICINFAEARHKILEGRWLWGGASRRRAHIQHLQDLRGARPAWSWYHNSGCFQVASDFRGRTCLPRKQQPARWGKRIDPSHWWNLFRSDDLKVRPTEWNDRLDLSLFLICCLLGPFLT